MVWIPLEIARIALREAQIHVKKPSGGRKLKWIRALEKDFGTAWVMVAKGAGTILIATDEYLANDRRLWQSIVSHAMLK